MKSTRRTDGNLLVAHLAGDGAAFEELYRRHEKLVYGTCLRRLRDPAEAEDAAAATFGVLLGKAGKLADRRGSLAGWLQWCAVNVSRRAARVRARRARREREAAEMRARMTVEERIGWRAALPRLDVALAALPAAQRDVVVMHYMQGRPRSEIAAELAVPEGTVAGRARLGLERLRRLLKREGAALSAAVLAAGLGETVSEVAVPAGLAAKVMALSQGACVPAAVAALAEGTMKTMIRAKLKTATVVLSTVTVLGAGGLLAARGLSAGEPAVSAKPAAVPEGAVDVLTGRSYWRYYITRRPAVVSVEAFKAAGKSESKPRALDKLDQAESPPPPADWVGPDTGDLDWPRSQPEIFGGEAFGKACTQRVSMRGKFAVTDPAAVRGLYLSIVFRGGVVVYLNGREVARGHLPAGELRAETEAELYSDDAWLLGGKYVRDDRAKGADEKAVVARRDRRLGPLELPRELLRKGTNVLAVEVWRGPLHPQALKWSVGVNATYGTWYPCELREVRLQAAGAGVVPNVERPKGLQVWCPDRNDRLCTMDYADPCETGTGVMRLVGARNGSYSGHIAVGSDAAITGLKVVPGDLSGPGKIPASGATVQYGVLDQDMRDQPAWFDGLSPEPPAEVKTQVYQIGYYRDAVKIQCGAVQLVVVRVRIPADAPAGDYRGSVAVSACGRTVQVPVELKVHGWTVPDPADFRTYLDLYQSPTSVAMKYDVPVWSEEHWKLMEQSWKILGRAGNKLVLTHLVEKTQYGNEEGTVLFVRKADGSYGCDLGRFERYVKMALTHCKRIDHVAVSVWHPGGWTGRAADSLHEITVLDEKTGKRESVKLPAQGTEEAKKILGPALAAIHAKLKEMGLEKQMCIGHLCDSTAPPEVLKAYDDVWPGEGGKARWMRGCHVATRETGPYNVKGGGQVVLHEYCYGGGVRDPVLHEARNYPGVFYFRAGYVSGEHRMPLSMYRTFADAALRKGTKGVGRICLDMWQVYGQGEKPGKNGKSADGYGDIYNRYPHSSIGQRRATITRMSWPGPKGALPTLRFEALIEGVEDTEALIYLDEAAAKHSAKLGPELTARCRQLAADRIHYKELAWLQYYKPVVIHPHHWGWRELSDRTYALAAEVAAKIR